jgi:hypothetical protein
MKTKTAIDGGFMLACKTTRDYFEKYCFMRNKTGVSFLNTTLFGTKEELTRLFNEDSNLGQIPLSKFLAYHSHYSTLWPGLTSEDTICLIKHSLIYQVIGAAPEFTD